MRVIKVICCLWMFVLLFAFTGCNKPINQPNSENSNVSVLGLGIDTEYFDALAQCDANSEITNVNCQFAQRWRSQGDYYVQCILQSELVYNEDIKSSITAISSHWVENLDIQIKNETAYLRSVYGSGSVIPVRLSEFEYSMCRQYAIEMYERCLEIGVIPQMIE